MSDAKESYIDSAPAYRLDSTELERDALRELSVRSPPDGPHTDGYIFYYYGHDFDSHGNATWTMVSDHTGQKACSNESVWTFPPPPPGKTRNWSVDPHHTCPGTGKWIVTVQYGG